MPFQSIAPATPGDSTSSPCNTRSPAVILPQPKSESFQPPAPPKQQQQQAQPDRQQSKDSEPCRGIVTSKEWVLPPRPKPGRKPSTDTPSSKRKAQNRQAQRAFRQRKAAKISEIEKQYMEIDQSRQKKQDQLQQSLEALARENARLRMNLESVQRQQSSSQSPISSYATSPAPAPYSPFTSSTNDKCGLCDSEAECVCVITSDSKPEPSNNVVPLPRRELDPSKRAKKIPRALATTSSATMETDFTASFSMSEVRRTATYSKNDNSEMLIETEDSTSIDPCGFCSNGTPCLCAEAAKDDKLQKQQLQQHPHPSSSSSHFRLNPQSGSPRPVLPPIAPGEGTRSKSYQQLPLLQGEIISSSSSASSPVTNSYATSAPTDSCSGNPATCAQCRSDPMSTLFCTSLNVLSRAAEIQSSTDKAEEEAKARATASEVASGQQTPKTPGECCGGSGPGTCTLGRDCSLAEHSIASPALSPPASIIDDEGEESLPQKHPSPPTTSTIAAVSRSSSSTAQGGTYIPCSAAYQTLSRHKNFNNADFGNLVGKLQTRGMQVEVNSVAKVLRELDRRFVAS